MIKTLLVFLGVIGVALKCQAEADQLPLSSPFGKDDRIGALNHLSESKALDALSLVRLGRTYSLAVETSASMPTIKPRYYSIEVFQPNNGKPLGSNKTTVADDIVHTGLGIGTQLDGLGHIGIDGVFYNGIKGADFIDPTGLKEYSTHKLPPIVTRGVLLDVSAHLGVDIVPEGTPIDPALIKAMLKAQQISLEKGDIVIFHTGWQRVREADPERFSRGEPGLDVQGAKFLAAQKVTAVGADNFALEVLPSRDAAQAYPVHQTLLTKNGIYILENLYTEELARDKIHKFMLVIGQPKLVGAVQSIINPVAIH